MGGEGAPVGAFRPFEIVAGLEDSFVPMGVPVTRPPFNGAVGISTEWPLNQCRVFEVVNGTYIQQPE